MDELNGDCVCYLVDIMEYLMKGDEDQRRVVEEMFPEDPDVAKVMLKQVFAHSQYKRGSIMYCRTSILHIEVTVNDGLIYPLYIRVP